MEAWGYAAAWLLAAILVVAAVAKLARREVTRSSFRALGLPAPGVLAVGVPGAELGTAALLVVVPPVGAWVALALLAAFTAFLVLHLARGTTAGCACFGGSARSPITIAAVGRNGLLLLLACVALFADAPR